MIPNSEFVFKLDLETGEKEKIALEKDTIDYSDPDLDLYYREYKCEYCGKKLYSEFIGGFDPKCVCLKEHE